MRIRRYLVIASIALVGLTASASADAGSASSVAPCPDYTFRQPFMPWADLGNYFISPAGSFEGNAGAWTLEGGAATVSGNEPFYVNASSDRRSLALPAGSSATTASICVTLAAPDLRLFVKNTGSPFSLLKVDINYTGLSGQPRTAMAGVVPGFGSWSPSALVLFLQNSIVPIVGDNGQTWVSFTFTPIGFAGNWQIDDVYVDPFKNQ